MYNNNNTNTNKKGARSLEEVLAMFWKKVTSLEENIKLLEKKLQTTSNNDSNLETLSTQKNTLLDNSDISDLSDDSDNDEPVNNYKTITKDIKESEHMVENKTEVVSQLSNDFKSHLVELDKKLENNISKYNLAIEQQNNKYNTLIESLNENKNETKNMYTVIKSQLSNTVNKFQDVNIKTNRLILSNLQTVLESINNCPVYKTADPANPLRDTVVDGIEQSGVDEKVDSEDPSNEDKADMPDANLTDADVTDANIVNADAENADAENADTENADAENDEQLNINNISFITNPVTN